MAVIEWLASHARVPVFVVTGGGVRDAVHELLGQPELRPVRSPREATVLIVAGWLPRPLVRPAALVHDQLPHPRATLWWTGAPRGELAGTFGEVAVSGDAAEAAAVARRLHEEVVSGRRPSEDALLPAVPPRPWRDVGPYGQGGEGMMGGAPYGRPMAMTGEARDGLRLDEVPVTLGPFLAGWPAGLSLDVVLQGDVVQEVTVRANPFAAEEPFPAPIGGPLAVVPDTGPSLRPAFHRVATVLDHHGLGALASRTRSLPSADGPRPVERLVRRLRRSRTLRWAMTGVGAVELAVLESLEPAEREAVAGDAWDRFGRCLDDVEGSATGGVAATARRGPRTAALLDLLPDLLVGAEIGDATTTVVSLHLDLEAAVEGREAVA